MRRRGTRFELIPMRPHDHIGWVYSGIAEFADLAKRFLEDGASLRERLMLVAEDPRADVIGNVAKGFGISDIEITSVSDVYGATGVVDTSTAYEALSVATEEAIAAGYSGFRVVADNSSLVQTAEGLEAWIGWELMADRLMLEKQLSALCAFDRDRVPVDTLRHLATLHPLSSASEPAPQFLLFADDGRLCVEGEVDSLAVAYVQRALETLPPKTSVVVDLTRANVRGDSARMSLFDLAQSGVEVTIVGIPERRVGTSEHLPKDTVPVA
jgi:copper chaperone CopZ